MSRAGGWFAGAQETEESFYNPATAIRLLGFETIHKVYPVLASSTLQFFSHCKEG